MKPQNRSTAYVLVGVGAVLFAVFVLVFVLVLSNDPEARSNLGKDVFEIGDAKGVARAIERDGPLLVADPLRRGRNLVVTHVGTWSAYAVRPSGPACRIEVDRDTKRVEDSCTGPVTNVAALPHYATSVTKKGKLVIDLRREVRPQD